MSQIPQVSTNQPLVEADGRPSQTTTALLEQYRKRLNKIASLDPATATIADIINAAKDV